MIRWLVLCLVFSASNAQAASDWLYSLNTGWDQDSDRLHAISAEYQYSGGFIARAEYGQYIAESFQSNLATISIGFNNKISNKHEYGYTLGRLSERVEGVKYGSSMLSSGGPWVVSLYLRKVITPGFGYELKTQYFSSYRFNDLSNTQYEMTERVVHGFGLWFR